MQTGSVGSIHEYWETSEASEAVFTGTLLADINQPYSCSQWANSAPGTGGDIIHDTNYGFHSLYNSQNAFPSTVWIDHEMKVYYKTNNTGYYLVNLKLEDMLEDCGECRVDGQVVPASGQQDCCETYGGTYSTQNNTLPELDVHTCLASASTWVNLCSECTGTVDSDGDGIDDECDDCLNNLGDVNADAAYDILDIVQVVNMILSGGANSTDFTACQLSNGDLSSDGIINILDVIQLINLVFENDGNGRLSSNNVKATFAKSDGDLYIDFESLDYFSGIQMSFLSDHDFDIDLKDNSHITMESSVHDGVLRLVAYSMFNDPFDGRRASFVIKGGSMLDVEDIEIVVSNVYGSGMEIARSVNDEVYQTGVHTFKLSKVYPNPFNPTTDVTFTIPNDNYVRLSAYNINGQEVSVIHDGYQSMGEHSYTWNASDLPSGMYYIRLVSGNHVETMKAVLMK